MPDTVMPAQLRPGPDAAADLASDPALDLPALLGHLGARAGECAAASRIAAPTTQHGYLESVAVDPSGAVWITGWMKRDQHLAFPAALAEGEEIFPASCVLTSYDRSDLPADSHAVIGMIETRWRPLSTPSGPRLILPGAGGLPGKVHLGALKPLRIASPREMLEEFSRVLPKCTGSRTAALHRMLTATATWGADPPRLAGLGTKAYVERILIVPGFGCMAEGWILSPLRRIHRLMLRLGETVLPADPATLTFRARPDIAEAFPGGGTATERAHFVVLFRGDVSPDQIADPVLKIVFNNGDVLNEHAGTREVRLLGLSAGVEEARRFFPSLHAEGFFPGFADAVLHDARARCLPPVAHAVTASPTACVFVVPAERSEAFLLFEQVARRVLNGQYLPGFIFIAASGPLRADVLALFADLANRPGVRASLFFTTDTAFALDLLPHMLTAVCARRFVFVGPGVSLTNTGWDLLPELFDTAENQLEFFGIDGAIEGDAPSPDGRYAACFAWSAEELRAWSAHAPAFLGGLYADNHLPRSSRTPPYPGAARRILPARLGAAASAVNRYAWENSIHAAR